MENILQYALIAMKVIIAIAGFVGVVVFVGSILGIAWHICTRSRSASVDKNILKVPITPRFSRTSWYGHLYEHAYGRDRGWVVVLRRMAFRTRFQPPPRQVMAEDAPQADRIGVDVDYRRRLQEARERCLAFLWLPPYEQPFFSNAPRGNLCPTFWKVMFACYVYVLGVTFPRFVRYAVARVWRMIVDPIVAVFRFVFQRFGRPIGYATVVIAYIFALHMVGEMTWRVTARTVVEPVTTRALEESLGRQFAEQRDKFEKDVLEACSTNVLSPFGNWDLPRCENEATETREQHFMHAWKNSFPARNRIAELEKGSLKCAAMEMDSFFEQMNELFPTQEDGIALGKRIAMRLRMVFIERLAQEEDEYKKRLVEERMKDAEVLITARTELEQYDSDRSMYNKFAKWCVKDGDHWHDNPQSPSYVSGAVCAQLATIFKDEIDDAQSEIRYESLGTALSGTAEWVKDRVKEYALPIGIIFGIILLIFVLCLLADIYWKVIAPIVEQIANGVWYAIVIITAPLWIPGYYVVWKVLLVISRFLRAVWMMNWSVRVRTAIRQFGNTIRQVWRDTMCFMRAFLHAKWERMCPMIDWVD